MIQNHRISKATVDLFFTYIILCNNINTYVLIFQLHKFILCIKIRPLNLDIELYQGFFNLRRNIQ